MAYILRFVQKYRPADRATFMAFEARFAELESRRPDFPQGRRSQPYAGREDTCSLIWECEFATLEELHRALALMGADAEHEALFQQAAPTMTDMHTEILEVLDLQCSERTA